MNSFSIHSFVVLATCVCSIPFYLVSMENQRLQPVVLARTDLTPREIKIGHEILHQIGTAGLVTLASLITDSTCQNFGIPQTLALGCVSLACETGAQIVHRIARQRHIESMDLPRPKNIDEYVIASTFLTTVSVLTNPLRCTSGSLSLLKGYGTTTLYGLLMGRLLEKKSVPLFDRLYEYCKKDADKED